jgi:hypothetical protein
VVAAGVRFLPVVQRSHNALKGGNILDKEIAGMEIKVISLCANNLIQVIRSGHPNDPASLEEARGLLSDLARPGRDEPRVVALEIEIRPELTQWFGDEYPGEHNKTHEIAEKLERKVHALHRAVVIHLEREGGR